MEDNILEDSPNGKQSGPGNQVMRNSPNARQTFGKKIIKLKPKRAPAYYCKSCRLIQKQPTTICEKCAGECETF